MEKKTSPQKNPYKVAVEMGKTYFWCSCSLSNKSPFCDGSHKKEGRFKPVKFAAEESRDIFLCGCRMTKNPPFCDGSHSK